MRTHWGYDGAEAGDRLDESHMNFFVVADSFEGARLKAKANSLFRNKRMHVDGSREIKAGDGYRIYRGQDTAMAAEFILKYNRQQDLRHASQAGAWIKGVAKTQAFSRQQRRTGTPSHRVETGKNCSRKGHLSCSSITNILLGKNGGRTKIRTLDP